MAETDAASGMPWGAAIGGGLGVASGLLGNSAARSESRRNREFQLSMSNTSHQREVKDLTAAGLNPILSANSGASTGAGSMASQSAPAIDLPAILQNMQFATSSDQNQQRINIDKANSVANIANTTSDTKLKNAERLVKEGGILSKYLGTSGGEVMNKVKKTLSPLMNKQPTQMNSSGGNLP